MTLLSWRPLMSSQPVRYELHPDIHPHHLNLHLIKLPWDLSAGRYTTICTHSARQLDKLYNIKMIFMMNKFSILLSKNNIISYILSTHLILFHSIVCCILFGISIVCQENLFQKAKFKHYRRWKLWSWQTQDYQMFGWIKWNTSLWDLQPGCWMRFQIIIWPEV